MTKVKFQTYYGLQVGTWRFSTLKSMIRYNRDRYHRVRLQNTNTDTITLGRSGANEIGILFSNWILLVGVR